MADDNVSSQQEQDPTTTATDEEQPKRPTQRRASTRGVRLVGLATDNNNDEDDDKDKDKDKDNGNDGEVKTSDESNNNAEKSDSKTEPTDETDKKEKPTYQSVNGMVRPGPVIDANGLAQQVSGSGQQPTIRTKARSNSSEAAWALGSPSYGKLARAALAAKTSGACGCADDPKAKAKVKDTTNAAAPGTANSSGE